MGWESKNFYQTQNVQQFKCPIVLYSNVKIAYSLSIYMKRKSPLLEEQKNTKEVDIYLNLIGKHKPQIHLSIKNMNINKIYKYMYAGVHLTIG